MALPGGPGACSEIPAGTLSVLDAESGTVEDHALAARRELEEETGYRAGRWRLVGSFWTAPGFAEELMHLYLATELRPAAEHRLSPDEDERIELERLPWREAVEAATTGRVADAKSILGLLWLARIGGRPGAVARSGGAPRYGEAQIRGVATPPAIARRSHGGGGSRLDGPTRGRARCRVSATARRRCVRASPSAQLLEAWPRA